MAEIAQRVVQSGLDHPLADALACSDVGDGLSEIVGTDHGPPVFGGKGVQRLYRVERSVIVISHKIMLRAPALRSLWSFL